MPRDLTDLMERATSFAPPEPHAAADVTSLAAAHLRRRRAGLAGAVAVVLAVAGGLGYGITRGHDTTPAPAARFKHDQTIAISAAVPAASLPGYRLEPWTIPSIQRFSGPYDPWPTYRSVDAEGRLIVLRYAAGSKPVGSPEVRLYDRPGASPSPLRIPPSPPGSGAGQPISWLPSFTGDGRLLWAPDKLSVDTARAEFHVTDLRGGHDVVAHSGFTVGKESFGGTPAPGTTTLGISKGSSGWGLSGDRYWFAIFDHNLPHLQGAADTVYSATFDGTLTKVADDVAVTAANDGRVAWITTHGELMTETAEDPSPRRVPVPLSAGCHLPPTTTLQGGLGALAVSHSVIAMVERCGTGSNPVDELLAFDPSGRMLVHVTGAAAFQLSLTPDAILGESYDAKTSQSDVVRYDLVTGTLANLGSVSKNASSPQGAGDYVLWYDAHGGHVAQIPD